MFRKMRRFKQELPKELCEEILTNNTSGVLALIGDEGYPYTVPMNFVYKEDRIYFHSAMQGHKIDAIAGCDKATFCVIDQDIIVREKYESLFKSVVAFGKISIITDEGEKEAALRVIADKYGDDDEENKLAVMKRNLNKLAMIRLDIEHLSGKAAMDIVNKKRQLRVLIKGRKRSNK